MGVPEPLHVTVPSLPRIAPTGPLLKDLVSARRPSARSSARPPGAPEVTALVDGNPERLERRQWRYAALLADAERAARALLKRFAPGERVAVWAPNSPEWVILEFAAALAGLTLVPVNPAYQGDELAHVLGHSAADGLFLADVRGRLPRLRDVLSFGEWDAFTADGTVGELPDVDPGRKPRWTGR